MNVLVVGGSGAVGTLIVPILAELHTLQIFDLHPPQDATLDYVAGDVTRYDDLVEAMPGMEALAYLAMGNLNWGDISGAESAFDVNVKGLYLALRAAHEAGIAQAVYASTLSIYAGNLMQRYFPDEELSPDSSELYGFTKRLGESVCLNAARLWGMNVNALRLCHPMTKDKWLAETVLGVPTIATTANDVARAFQAALEYRGGFQAFTISGDYENKIVNMAKARRLLGWEPLARPTKQAVDR
jgi:nucleoside-diphosphate-sugar epimerase